MSNTMKVCCVLLGILLNHSITDAEFFHWLTIVSDLISVLIRSRIFLLTRPISLFAGLINLHVGLLLKFSLWSFRVMNACFFAMVSNLSSISRSLAIFLASSLMSS